MKKTLITIGSVLPVILPTLAFAATVDTSYFDSLITAVGKILNNLVILLIGLAVVWFIWNVVRYTMSEDEDGKAKAKSQMINGIIAITVAVSIWGIVAIIRRAFGVDTGQAPQSVNYMIPGGAPSGGMEAGNTIPLR